MEELDWLKAEEEYSLWIDKRKAKEKSYWHPIRQTQTKNMAEK
jgi:hypothetical protein